MEIIRILYIKQVFPKQLNKKNKILIKMINIREPMQSITYGDTI